MFRVASSWNMYSLPVRLATSPVHRSFDSTPNRTWRSAQDLEQRPQRLLEVGLEGPGTAEPHEHVVLRAGRRSRGRPSRRTSAAGRSRGPRCSSAARGGCRRAHVVRRVAVRHETAPRPDDEREVLDPDRALVLAGAARRALPEHRLRCRFRPSLVVALAGEERLLRLQDERLGVQRLAGAPGRAVHLTAAAFDAGERVEHGLAAEILDGLEPDLLLLEVEVRQRCRARGDLRNTVIGESTRWKCFEAGISARKARMTTACTHQLTRPADRRARRAATSAGTSPSAWR